MCAVIIARHLTIYTAPKCSYSYTCLGHCLLSAHTVSIAYESAISSSVRKRGLASVQRQSSTSFVSRVSAGKHWSRSTLYFYSAKSHDQQCSIHGWYRNYYLGMWIKDKSPRRMQEEEKTNRQAKWNFNLVHQNNLLDLLVILNQCTTSDYRNIAKSDDDLWHCIVTVLLQWLP